MELGPSLLEQNCPQLVLRRSCRQRFAVQGRDPVIDHDRGALSTDIKEHGVDTRLVDDLTVFTEEIPDELRLFSQGRQRSQKVATSDVGLVDVVSVDIFRENCGVFEEISGTCPYDVLAMFKEVFISFVFLAHRISRIREILISPFFGTLFDCVL